MKIISGLLISVWTFLMPIYSLVLLVIGFVLLDTITGIWASIKLKGRKSFRSGILWNMAPKIVMYSSAILLAFLIDNFIFGGALMGIKLLLSKASCVVGLWIEGTSINENSVKLGNRSIDVIIGDIVRNIKGLKRDINDITE